jgi:hypothetical protein
MKTSESILKLLAAFAQAQGEIGNAHKDAKNPHFGSQYADLASVVDAIRPAASKHGLAFLQHGTLVEGNRLQLITRIVHESGEWLEDEMLMPVAKVDPQGFGSAMTYARRYALQAIFGVAPAEDDGNAATGVQQKQQYSSPAKPAYNSNSKPAYTPPAKPATPAAFPAAQAAPAKPELPAQDKQAVLDGAKAAAAKGEQAYLIYASGLSPVQKRAIGKEGHEAFLAGAREVKAAV